MKIYFKGTAVHNDPKFYLGNQKIDLTNTSKENPLEVADDVGAKLCGDLPNLIFEVEEEISETKQPDVTVIEHTIPREVEMPVTSSEKPKVYIVTARGDGKRGLKDGGLLEKGKKFNANSKSVRSIPQMLMWKWIIEYKE